MTKKSNYYGYTLIYKVLSINWLRAFDGLLLISGDLGILLILVLSDQVTDVLVSFLEFHLVHTLTLVPVQEGLSLVHGAELGGQALEYSLERGGVRHEGT